MDSVLASERSHTESYVPATQMATDFERDLLNARIFYIYYVTIQKPGALNKGRERYQQAQKMQKDMVAFANSNEDLSSLRPAIAQLGTDLDVYGVELDASIAMVQRGVLRGDAYDAQVKDWAAKGAVMVADAGKLEVLCAALSDGSTATSIDRLTRSIRNNLLIFFAALALSTASAIFMVRQINASLRLVSNGLRRESEQLLSAATEVASASQSVAQEATELATMIEQTSASAVQISGMASQSAENARTTVDLVVESARSSESANRAVKDCVEAMDAIGSSSGEIAKTLRVITEIAFQTDILALNASVEAARAGEAGLGFAVVADEVRNLAKRCSDASQVISVLVEQSLANAASGRTKIHLLAASEEKVNEMYAQLKPLVEKVLSNSIEQNEATTQIGRALNTMEKANQQSASAAEETASRADELHEQSNQLHLLAAGLGRLVDGG